MHFHEIQQLSGIIIPLDSKDRIYLNDNKNENYQIFEFIKNSSITYQNNSLNFDILDEKFLLSDKHFNEISLGIINDFIVTESGDPEIKFKILCPLNTFVKKGGFISLLHLSKGPFGCIPPMTRIASNDVVEVVDSNGNRYLKIPIAYITDKRNGKERKVTLFAKLEKGDKFLAKLDECIKNGKFPEGEIRGKFYFWKAHWQEEIEIDNVKKEQTIIKSNKIKINCE